MFRRDPSRLCFTTSDINTLKVPERKQQHDAHSSQGGLFPATPTEGEKGLTKKEKMHKRIGYLKQGSQPAQVSSSSSSSTNLIRTSSPNPL